MLPLVTIWLAWLLPLGSPAFVPTTILLRAFQQPPQPPVSSPLEGAWEGTLQVGAIELRLGFTLQPKAVTPPGEKIVLTGTMVSIDQGAAEIPVTRATLTSDTFQIVVPAAVARFAGAPNAARHTGEGVWHQGLNQLPPTLKKVPAITRLRRPQEPK
ncbi:MAG TPA: hypothetical protein PKA06_11085, partial [Gemmatales bacterium]|nr:hypothetical protein [Gemmatales bacterium]